MEAAFSVTQLFQTRQNIAFRPFFGRQATQKNQATYLYDGGKITSSIDLKFELVQGENKNPDEMEFF